jgi:AcrR family transcriptional regulator
MRADARRNRARILAAAEAVFAEAGASASTEEVASRAGVAIGTVFRHFPTKDELLRAIMKNLLARLTEEVAALVAHGEPGTALFTFFTDLVAQAAQRKTVVDLLAGSGTEVGIAGPIAGLHAWVAQLLAAAQRAGTVRADVRPAEVLALLSAACQGALHGGWDRDLQDRSLAILFDGLRAGARPAGARESGRPEPEDGGKVAGQRSSLGSRRR